MNAQNLLKMLGYHVWATREQLNCIENQHISLPEVTQLLNHIIGAERIWINRVEGKPLPNPVFPDFKSVNEFASEFTQTAEKWESLLASTDLDGFIHYHDLKGNPYQSSVGDIVFHVFNHATYHRGQIAAKIRAAGFQPAATDFIVYSRIRV